MDQRVNDLLEVTPSLGVLEDDTGQLPSVERAGRIDDVRAEAGDDRGKSRTSRLDGLPGQDIGINRRNAKRLELGPDVTLAGGNTAGERDSSSQGTANCQPLTTSQQPA